MFGVSNIQLKPEFVSDKPKTASEKFSEETEILWEELKITYYATKSSHFSSPEYLKEAKRLLKIIKKLGSCVITIAAVEQLGISFPEFSDLTIHELICIASYNFRKTNAALEYFSFDMLDEYLAYSDLFLKWANILERLWATDEKIKLIKSGQIDANDLL